MKVPKPSLILHSIGNTEPLPRLTAEETETVLQDAENVRSKASAGTSSWMSTKPVSTDVLTTGSARDAPTAQEFFKKPTLCSRHFPDTNSSLLRRHTSTMQQQGTPKTALPRLINLSFSLPNSPKTPRIRTNPEFKLATPAFMVDASIRHRQLDQSVLNTPCVMEALGQLQMAQDTGLPDMLALIEDDRSGLSQVERQLLCNTDVELTDHTVVDYLLDVTPHPAPPSPSPASSSALCRAGGGGDGEASSCSANAAHREDVAEATTGSAQLERNGRLPCIGQLPARESEEAGMETGDELKVRRKQRRRCQKRMTPEETLAVRRQRRRRGSQSQQKPAPQTSSLSSPKAASPNVRRSKRSRRQSERFEIRW